MELTQLAYFCDVALTQHITRSAQRLHIAQPALSQSMHRLEEELGMKLFERTGRNIRLTPEGAYLNARLRPILEDLDGAIDAAKAFHEGSAPVIRVGIFAASGIVVDALADFLAEEAGAAFEVTQSDSSAPWDVGVRTVVPRTKGVGAASATAVAAFTESIGVAVPVKRGYESEVCLQDLEEERFISLAGSRSFRQLCDGLCVQRGFSPRHTFESDSPAMVKTMISAGLGVGFWPERSWGPVDSEKVRWVPLRDAGFERMLCVERKHSTDEVHDAWVERFTGFLVTRIGAAFGVSDAASRPR